MPGCSYRRRASWPRMPTPPIPARRTIECSTLLPSLHNPDVPKLRRHSVLLQLNGTGGSLAQPRRVQRHRTEFAIVIQLRAIEQHRDPRSRRPSARAIEARRVEIDIERLPFERRTRAADSRPRIRRSAIVESRAGVAVKATIHLVDVGFVPVLNVHAAIG